jgi:hypothetical protein
MQRGIIRLLNAFIVLLVATTVGCGSGGSTARQSAISHVKAITALYDRAASTLGRNPQSEEEFKRVIADGKPDLKVLAASSIDDLFVSDRDGKPLVVLYGKEPNGPGSLVVYEQEGKDGERLMGFKNGQTIEADEAQFSKLTGK